MGQGKFREILAWLLREQPSGGEYKTRGKSVGLQHMWFLKCQCVPQMKSDALSQLCQVPAGGLSIDGIHDWSRRLWRPGFMKASCDYA